MKIATWNIERPTKTSKKNQAIIDCLNQVNADILILTESNEIINLGNSYNYFYTSKPIETYYKEGERRVSILSKYQSIKQLETFRGDTSICYEFITPIGELAVYGTVIGTHGNRPKSFIDDLDQQLIDFDKISKGNNVCIGGDFNMSFSDNYYHTNDGRLKLGASFEKLKLKNLTAKIPQNIDHIVLTKSFVSDRIVNIETWNIDKKLSDHIGVSVEIM